MRDSLAALRPFAGRWWRVTVLQPRAALRECCSHRRAAVSGLSGSHEFDSRNPAGGEGNFKAQPGYSLRQVFERALARAVPQRDPCPPEQFERCSSVWIEHYSCPILAQYWAAGAGLSTSTREAAGSNPVTVPTGLAGNGYSLRRHARYRAEDRRLTKPS